MKLKNISTKIKGEFENQVESLKNSNRSLVFTAVGSFILMGAAALAVFFMSVQGAEKVVMPDVVGKNLYTGLFELQQNELYGKINYVYSDDDKDSGMIIDQEPRARSIIKAYHRVTITVSRGKALTTIEDYTNQFYSDVRNRFEILYAGEAPLVTIANPVYVASDLPEGTIIAQYPEEGTDLYSAATLTLIVSNGNKSRKVEVPEITGKTIPEILQIISQSSVTFNFTAAADSDGTYSVTAPAGTEVDPYSVVPATISFEARKDGDEIISGLFRYWLPDYPFPVPVRLETIDTDGNSKTLVTMYHPGKEFTVPYEVKKDSTLTLYVFDEKKESVQVK